MDHLTAIKAFQRIAEAGSFTRAAAQLEMPRSSLSKALRELENHLGVRLLQRTTRSVSLTIEGAEYYRRISDIVAQLDEADLALRGMGAMARGRIRVDMHCSLAEFVLIPRMDDFRQRYPDIQIALGITDRPVRLVDEGVDCVVRAGALNDSALIARTLFNDRVITCASPHYLAHHGTPDTPQSLQDEHQIIGYFSAETSEIWPMCFRREETEYQISRFDVAANNSAGVIRMMLSGLGVAQIHESVVSRFLASGELVTLLDNYSTFTTPVSVIYPSSRQLSMRVRIFVDWLVEQFGQ